MSGLGRRSHYRKHLTDSVMNDLPEPDPSNGERLAKIVGTRGSNQFEIIVANDCKSSVVVDSTTLNDDDTSISASVSVTSLIAEPESKGSRNDGSGSSESVKRTPRLAILPTKFRKLVWLKRNDYVIVTCADDVEDEGECEDDGIIRYMVKHILYKDQVKHLRREGMWPTNDPLFTDSNSSVSISTVSAADTDPPKAINRIDDIDDHISGNENDDGEENNQTVEDDGIVYPDDGIDDDNDDYFVNSNRMARLAVDDDSSCSSSDEY